jgi:hypothetical protein
VSGLSNQRWPGPEVSGLSNLYASSVGCEAAAQSHSPQCQCLPDMGTCPATG